MDLKHKCNISKSIKQKLATDESYRKRNLDNLAIARKKRWDVDDGRHATRMREIMCEPERMEAQQKFMCEMWKNDQCAKRMLCNRHNEIAYFNYKLKLIFDDKISIQEFELHDHIYKFSVVEFFKKVIVASNSFEEINKIERWCKLKGYQLIVVNKNSIFDNSAYEKIISSMHDDRNLIKIGSDFEMPMIGVS